MASELSQSVDGMEQGDESPMAIVLRTIKQVEGEAAREERRSLWLRRASSTFTFAAAVLGVGAPTLVTYFLQDGEASEIMKLVAILAAAFAGATTVLLNTFRWGQRFGTSSLAAIALRELASTTRLRLQDALRTVKEEAIPEKLAGLNHRTLESMYEIARSVVRNEADVFSRTPEALGIKGERASGDDERRS